VGITERKKERTEYVLCRSTAINFRTFIGRSPIYPYNYSGWKCTFNVYFAIFHPNSSLLYTRWRLSSKLTCSKKCVNVNQNQQLNNSKTNSNTTSNPNTKANPNPKCRFAFKSGTPKISSWHTNMLNFLRRLCGLCQGGPNKFYGTVLFWRR